MQTSSFENSLVSEELAKVQAKLGISRAEAGYLVFTGDTTNTTYNLSDENILILSKDGSVKEISAIENTLIHQTLSTPVKKFYFCFPKEQVLLFL